MTSILEDLFYGNIDPNANQFDCKSEYGKFVKIVLDNEEKLTAYLGGEEQHLFSQLINAQSEILRFSELERFIEGFQLGAKFMLDVFLIQENSVIRDIY